MYKKVWGIGYTNLWLGRLPCQEVSLEQLLPWDLYPEGLGQNLRSRSS